MRSLKGQFLTGFLLYSKIEMRASPVSGSVVEPVAGCSTGSSFFDAGIALLTTLFPDESIEDVIEALLRYEDVDLAACALMSRATNADQTFEEGQAGNNVCDTLEKLRAKMKYLYQQRD